MARLRPLMKHPINMLLLLSFLFFYLSPVFAQSPDFSGTWVINKEKSKILSWPKGMTSTVFIISQKADSFQLIIHHVFGAQQDTLVIKLVADGGTQKVLGILEGKLERVKGGLHAELWKSDFSDKVTYTFGKDNNEFIADEVLASKTDNHHNIWVFDRDRSK